ncbi:carbohydrate kinase [Labrys miyagiensis]|uniref:ATP:glycerol 3-phosphotransferase n=2 Tax=Labrys miyagiensis TaxID=346912 RepID=A0ABQ6CR58_9HYPH|nr:carbohydrate kinase [Labrys miyagiensis]
MALANQGETVIAWDRVTKRALYHAIVWQDQRSQGRLDALPASTKAQVSALSGLPVDAYFSASKIAWLLEHVPAVGKAARDGRLGIGTSESFFIDRLTGQYVTDPTTASRTSLMNIADGRFDDGLCQIFGVPRDLLPKIVPTAGFFGVIRRRDRELPLVVSIVDQQAALFGHGCRTVGDAKITFGTGSFALALSGAAPILDRPGLVPTIAWQLPGEAPVYALDGGDYTAAAAVDWAISIGLAGSYEDFAFDDATPAITRGIAFVPALAGLAAPYWRRDVAASFVGLRQATAPADLRKAVLEGIAYRGAELIEALGGEGDGPVSIDGGLARNSYFVQFLADAMARPVCLQESAELTALGLAEMAYLASSLPVPERLGEPSRLIVPGPRSPAIRERRAYFQTAINLAAELASSQNAPAS